MFRQSTISQALPMFATPFIGRTVEIAGIMTALQDPTIRLLTLTGSGGIGKTRLSLKTARQFLEQAESGINIPFADGIFFIALAPLSSIEHIITAIAESLDYQFLPQIDAKQQLFDFLYDKQLLLILDNFEHLMVGAPIIAELLEATAYAKVMVTSRERLNLPEEKVFALQGMVVPESDNVENIEAYSSLLLFQQIAHKVDWRFSISVSNEPCIIRICRLVEGIPLAIELAAAWTRGLSCEDILGELQRNFEFLGDSLTHVPERHRSLRIVFEYSWNLLTEGERAIFQQLSVFQGGFLKEAAEHIAGASARDLLSLVDKSLLDHNTQGRYKLHELLRQFTAEKLNASLEAERATRVKHCAFYANFLHQREAVIKVHTGPNAKSTSEVRAELANLRIMWQWALDNQQVDEIDHAATTLYHYHRNADSNEEAVSVFLNAAAMIEKINSSGEYNLLLSRLLGMAGGNAGVVGQMDLAHDVAQRGLMLAQDLGDAAAAATARCHCVLGDIAFHRGKYAEAAHHLVPAVDYYQDVDFTVESLLGRASLGKVYHYLGDYDRAHAVYERWVNLMRAADNQYQLGFALIHLGFLENANEHYDEAKQACLEALEIFDEYDYPMGLVHTHNNLGHIHTKLREYAQAREHFRAVLQTYHDHNLDTKVLQTVMNTLVGVAILFAIESNPASAAELLALVQRHPRAAAETKDMAQELYDELEAELSPMVFQATQQRGASFSLKQIMPKLLDELANNRATGQATDASFKEDELLLLQRISVELASGSHQLPSLEDNAGDETKAALATIAMTLEKEKARIMAKFMESASHDLRTPLTVINTSLYLLDIISDPDEQQARLDLVKEQVTHLQNAIEDLITMSRLDAILEFEFQPIDLNHIIANIETYDLVKLTQGRDLSLSVTLCDTPLMIEADEEYLRRAMVNIVENAIQFTPDDGLVLLKVYSENNQAVVEIRDTGIGIAEADLPRIFERFYRADKARTQAGHTGLGLAIAKKIIDTHNGTVDVVSSRGEGTTFQVKIALVL